MYLLIQSVTTVRELITVIHFEDISYFLFCIGVAANFAHF